MLSLWPRVSVVPAESSAEIQLECISCPMYIPASLWSCDFSHSIQQQIGTPALTHNFSILGCLSQPSFASQLNQAASDDKTGPADLNGRPAQSRPAVVSTCARQRALHHPIARRVAVLLLPLCSFFLPLLLLLLHSASVLLELPPRCATQAAAASVTGRCSMPRCFCFASASAASAASAALLLPPHDCDSDEPS